jgi:hypothetical protein
MARQFREQLEEEVQLEQARRSVQESAAPQSRTPPPAPSEAAAATPPPAPAEHPTDETGALATGTAALSPGANERRP